MLALNTDELSHDFHLEMTAVSASYLTVLVNISPRVSQVECMKYTDLLGKSSCPLCDCFLLLK